MHSRLALSGILGLVLSVGPGLSPPTAGAPAAQLRADEPVQRLDDEYTRLIKQHLQDPRISTDLVDHLPASDTVPSPLKFLGRVVGTPGELTYASDIHRYYAALAQAS